jgi:hypothetical protein
VSCLVFYPLFSLRSEIILVSSLSFSLLSAHQPDFLCHFLLPFRACFLSTVTGFFCSEHVVSVFCSRSIFVLSFGFGLPCGADSGSWSLFQGRRSHRLSFDFQHGSVPPVPILMFARAGRRPNQASVIVSPT